MIQTQCLLINNFVFEKVYIPEQEGNENLATYGYS